MHYGDKEGNSDWLVTMKTKQTAVRPDEVLPASEPKAQAVLTSRELEALELLSYGYENQAIAEHFQVTRQAVKNMLRITLLKLGADNRTHAVAVAFRYGWLFGPGRSAPSPEAQQGESVSTNPTRNGTSVTRHWNSKGMIDSFCSTCGLTIARAFSVADLVSPESRHECQVLERRRAIRIVSRNGLTHEGRRDA